MVVNLAVEGDHGIAIFGAHGLIAAAEIDDFETNGAERCVGRLMYALLIGTAMIEALHRAAQYGRGRFAAEMSKACYATHKRRTRLRSIEGNTLILLQAGGGGWRT
jgi:signal transduction histidine kinase